MTTDTPPSPKPVPSKSNQRSLAAEFEKLCSTTTNSSNNESSHNDESFETAKPAASKPAVEGKPSPNTVLEFDPDEEEGLPHFELHPDLQGKLSQETLDRVAVYHIIKSINGEADDMSINDSSQYSTTIDGQKIQVDEERWLLSVLPSKDAPSAPSPTSFLEAIGEKPPRLSDDQVNSSCTPNPLNVVMNSRTQLWKPSRSWWEAKSGKNPWIEPRFHARRWRFLWPLIHYHKFLAKCIKKLKRYGVDYTDKNELPTFVRAEVVAISKHLACVSEFTSEEWTNTLPKFHSWDYPNIPSIHFRISRVIQGLAVRPTGKVIDEESPILLQHCGANAVKQRNANSGGMMTPRGARGASNISGIRRSYTYTYTNHHLDYGYNPRAQFDYNSSNATGASSGYEYPPAINMYHPPPPPPHHHHPHFSPYQLSMSHPHLMNPYYHYPYPATTEHADVSVSMDESFEQGCWQHLDPMRSLASPPRYASDRPGYSTAPLKSPVANVGYNNNRMMHAHYSPYGYQQSQQQRHESNE